MEDWEIGASRVNDSKKASTFDRTSGEPTLVGQLLDGRFQIEKDLTDDGADAGGIGRVFLARDMKLLGRQVVVKILQKKALENPEIVRKFHHEKEALIRLEHPNIVRILDSGTLSDGNPFMVMEYISGYSLRRLLRERSRLNLDEVANIVEQVTAALAAAHAKGVLHRDIKPENIMLTAADEGREHVRLIDFGIARVSESLLAPETLIGHGSGTLKYIAPEQLSGSLEQTGAADIFSFSVVVYEMLTGDLPFKPSSSYITEAIVEMYEMHKLGVTVKPSSLRQDLPPEAERILLSGMHYAADQRPKDARVFGRELAVALRLIVSKDGVHPAPAFVAGRGDGKVSHATVERQSDEEPQFFGTPPPIPFPQTVNTSSKRPLLLAAVAILVLAALAIPLGIIIWNSSQSEIPIASAEDRAIEDSREKANRTANTSSSSEPEPTSRELSYYLIVQKMRDGKPFEDPFKSSGQEIFESGYKFSMAFESDADGYLYLFNEGKDETGKLRFYLLFPTPSINDGVPRILARKRVETAKNTFGGGRGTESIWLIWTKEKDASLNEVFESATQALGSVPADDVATLRDFLDKYSVVKPESEKDSGNQRTVIKAKGDTVVHRIELEHR